MLTSETLRKTLGTGNLRETVAKPDSISLEQWIIGGTSVFVQHTERIYSILGAVCTHTSCPCMGAGPRCEYLWGDDGTSDEAPARLSAPAHVGRLLEWAQFELDDPTLLPRPALEADSLSLSYFHQRMGFLYRRLLRVYAHIYSRHLADVEKLGAEKLLNSTLKHGGTHLQNLTARAHTPPLLAA